MGCRKEGNLVSCGPLRAERESVWICLEREKRRKKKGKEKLICCIVPSKAAFTSSRPQQEKEPRTDEYFCLLAVLESTRGPGVTQITAHSCVHAPAHRTVCPTRGIHFSMTVFHFINKRFLSNETGLLYSSCLDAGRSRRIQS